MNPFPLRVTPFEHYMLADDRPEYPMTFLFRFTFEGAFDVDRFMGALGIALRRHPMLHAYITGSPKLRSTQIQWHEAGDMPVPFEWLTTIKGRNLSIQRWRDLSTEPSLHVWAYRSGSDTIAVMQFHHCCCDGIGVLHFLETLLGIYNHIPQNENTARQLDGTFFSTRHRQGVSRFDDCIRAPHDLRRISRFFFANPDLLSSRSNVPTAPPQQISVSDLVSYTFSVDATRHLLSKAKRLQIAFNTLLLGALFQTILEWNTLLDGHCRWIRIAVPVNLRPDTKLSASAINATSMVFLDRSREQIEDVNHLFNSIDAEVKDVKRRGTGWALIQVLRVAGLFPGGIERLVTPNHCLATSVLSNLGVVQERTARQKRDAGLPVDRLKLKRIEPFPPVRPLTRAAVDAITYGNHLTLTVGHDPSWMRAEDAREFLSILKGILWHVAGDR